MPQDPADDGTRAARTLSIPQALGRIGPTADDLLERAALPGGPLFKAWIPEAGTWLYQVRAEVPGDAALLEATVAALLGDGPGWFTAMSDRHRRELEPPSGVERAVLDQLRFDMGMGQFRRYDLLVGLVAPEPTVRVLTQRSVHPEGFVDETRAFTLAPSGDVVRLVGDRVVWDHIGTTPGGALLPPTADRWLMNTLRWLGLDQAERATYRAEGEAFVRWATGRASAVSGRSSRTAGPGPG